MKGFDTYMHKLTVVECFISLNKGKPLLICCSYQWRWEIMAKSVYNLLKGLDRTHCFFLRRFFSSVFRMRSWTHWVKFLRKNLRLHNKGLSRCQNSAFLVLELLVTNLNCVSSLITKIIKQLLPSFFQWYIIYFFFFLSDKSDINFWQKV